MGRKYKTEFTVKRYSSPEELAKIMQELWPDGWRADSVKLGNNSDEGGWTIFSRTYEARPSLLEVEFPSQLLWDILNDYKLFGDYDDQRRAISREISNRLKQWYEQNLVKE